MVSLSILCQKDIISVETGQNIGRADDVEFSEKTAVVENLVVFGRPKFFGLFGREKDIKIAWNQVITVGRDVILISSPQIRKTDKNGRVQIDYD